MPERYLQYGRRCPTCKDEIYSNSVNDYVECLCGDLYIDGGFLVEHVVFRSVEDPGFIERVSRWVDKNTLPKEFYQEPERRKALAEWGSR